jgi:ubiquitin carboxyl-terminal hydrolase L3
MTHRGALGVWTLLKRSPHLSTAWNFGPCANPSTDGDPNSNVKAAVRLIKAGIMTASRDLSDLPPLEKWFVALGKMSYDFHGRTSVLSRFVENYPQVFTQLARHLGLSPVWTFHGIYSLTEPSLLDMVPRPIEAMIFTAPGETYHRARDEETNAMASFKADGDNDAVFWFEQTLRNSCGLMAFLRAACNSAAKEDLRPGSVLYDLRARAIGLSIAGRSRLLESSAALEAAHGASANLGDTAAAPIPYCPPNHYIAFVKASDGNL